MVEASSYGASAYGAYAEAGAADSQVLATRAQADGYDDMAGPNASTTLGLDEVATAAAQAVQTLMKSSSKPPPPLPPGWHVKESLSNPGYCYYFHQSTGVCSWQPPHQSALTPASAGASSVAENDGQREDDDDEVGDSEEKIDNERGASKDGADSGSTAPASAAAAKKRPADEGGPPSSSSAAAAASGPSASKRPRLASDKPKQVRILHILKKHKESRRPSSWRQPKVTISKEEATEELEELQSVLLEESGDNLRATFEELARTESDCSSAKRGGDLGFFGPKKMQPPFEEASFALEVGQMSGIVETSSGVHILLRVG